MKNIFDVLLLRGMWKFKPVHVILLWLAIAAYGWLASPYFMYHIVGAPKPRTAPRYSGTIHHDGNVSFGKRGLKPPQYVVRTNGGDVEIHCGYLPKPVQCFWVPLFDNKPFQVEVGYWPYWGVDYFHLGPPNENFNELGIPKAIEGSRRSWLTHDVYRLDLLKFCLFLGIYLVLVLIYLIPKRWIREMQGPTVPTEAEIAEQMRMQVLTMEQKHTIDEKPRSNQ